MIKRFLVIVMILGAFIFGQKTTWSASLSVNYANTEQPLVIEQ